MPDGGTTTTTLPPTGTQFSFGAAATVCVAEVPTIRITFLNTFPELAGQVGLLTMADVNGNVVETLDLVYEPGTTVDLLYPGTSVNPDGSIDDVPGWILTDDGFWIRDPSDEFLREGINLTYTVNPTATAFVTYPPESSACANPDGPFGPGVTPPPPGVGPPAGPSTPLGRVISVTGSGTSPSPAATLTGWRASLRLPSLPAVDWCWRRAGGELESELEHHTTIWDDPDLAVGKGRYQARCICGWATGPAPHQTVVGRVAEHNRVANPYVPVRSCDVGHTTDTVLATREK